MSGSSNASWTPLASSVGEIGTPRVFQDRFAVSAKWFHSAGFWPVFRQSIRDVDHMQII
jgi:hypothetical protein